MRAGERAGAAVDSRLEAERVDVGGERGHVWEAVVGQDVSLGIARGAVDLGVGRCGLAGPAVVDVDELIAVVGHTGGDHGGGGGADVGVRDVLVVAVPVVPTHLRCQADGVAYDDFEGARVFAERVGCDEGDEVVAGFRGRGAGDDSGLTIELERDGKIFGGESDGAVAGGGDAIEEGMAGANAVILGPLR